MTGWLVGDRDPQFDRESKGEPEENNFMRILVKSRISVQLQRGKISLALHESKQD